MHYFSCLKGDDIVEIDCNDTVEGHDRRTFIVLGGAALTVGMAGPVSAAGTGSLIADRMTFDAAARWVGRNVPAKPSAPWNLAAAPMLRRGFEAGAPVRSALLRLAGYGYCHAEINGTPVSDGVLDPPPSQFDKSVFGRVFDVTALLRSGSNAIGVMLGRSFVSGVTGPGTPWIAEPRVLVQLDIVLANGTAERLVSDASWKMADSPIHDWMYFGEHYDARVAQAGWSSAGFDDSAWAPAPVQPAPTRAVIPARVPAVVVTDTWAPPRSTTLASGATVYDFGRMTAGWGRIKVKGAAGTRLEIAYGQQLNADGSVALCLPWSVTDPALSQHLDLYTLKGGSLEEWEPRFTRHGFQYVQVTVKEGRLDQFSIEARECHTPSPSTGSFACSNPVINKMHENQRRSLMLNHWGFPTDTSHRDRQGWTADTFCYMDSGLLNFGGYLSLYRDWLSTLRASQTADGSVPCFAPNTYGFPAFNDPSWGGMIVLIPWTLYQFTGDIADLADNYPAASRWMDLMDKAIAATGNLYTGFSFGDHGPPGAENSGTMNIANIEGPDITRNAHLYREARVLARIARLLGRKGDAARYEAMADRILPAFNAAYFDPKTNTYSTPTQKGYRQTSNLAPLAYDMVPAGHQDAVFANLVADIEGRGLHLNTGAIGTKLILPVLTRFGRADLAFALVAQTEYPSWGYWVTQGATTSWEVWRNKGIEQTLDHPFLGSFDEWLFQHLAGIQAAKPGYARIRIEPVLAVGLDHASAKVTTPRGEVSSQWKREGEVVRLDITVPASTPGELVLSARPERVKITNGQASLIASDGTRSRYEIRSHALEVQVHG